MKLIQQKQGLTQKDVAATKILLYLVFLFREYYNAQTMKNSAAWPILLVLITLLWGSLHPISKHILNGGVDAFMLAFLRYFFATIPLLPFFIMELKKQERLSWKEMGELCFLGVISGAGFALLMYLGLSRTNASSSSILINTQPLFAALFSALIIKEKLTIRHMVGILIGLIGIVFVATRGEFSVLTLKNEFLLGNLLCIMASICLSYFYVGLKKYVIKFGSTIPTFITNAVGTAVLCVAVIAGGSQFSGLLSVGWKEWIFILYIGIVATALTYLLFHRAITLIGVIRATGFKFLVPVFGIILAVIFLGERLNLYVLIGISIVLAAIAVIQLPGKSRAVAGTGTGN